LVGSESYNVEKLEAVQAALNERDVYLMTVSDLRGCGRQRGYTEVIAAQGVRYGCCRN
jgi:nitrogen regulatory protein P-II 2